MLGCHYQMRALDVHEALVIIVHHFGAGGSITCKMWSGMQGLKERGSQEIGVLGWFDTEVLINIKNTLVSQVPKLGSMWDRPHPG